MKYVFIIIFLFISQAFAHESTIEITPETTFKMLERDIETAAMNGSYYVIIKKNTNKNEFIKLSFSASWDSDINGPDKERITKVRETTLLYVSFNKNELIFNNKSYKKNDFLIFKKLIDENYKNKNIGVVLKIEPDVQPYEYWNYLKFIFGRYIDNIVIYRNK